MTVCGALQSVPAPSKRISDPSLIYLGSLGQSTKHLGSWNLEAKIVSDFKWLFRGQKKKFAGPAEFRQDGTAETASRPLEGFARTKIKTASHRVSLFLGTVRTDVLQKTQVSMAFTVVHVYLTKSIDLLICTFVTSKWYGNELI